MRGVAFGEKKLIFIKKKKIRIMAAKKIGLEELRKIIRKRLEESQGGKDAFREGVEENPKITIRSKYDERNPNQGKETYSINYQFTTPEGQEIEIEGTLRPYHTGRDYEYEFEPGWFAEDADSNYYDEHWEEIENQILEKFYQTDKFELDENEEVGGEGDGAERIYLNRNLSDYFGVPYTKNDGEETIINAGTLKEKGLTKGGGWDKEHLALYDKYEGADLLLKGIGFGWWKIIKVMPWNFLEENKNTNNMNIMNEFAGDQEIALKFAKFLSRAINIKKASGYDEFNGWKNIKFDSDHTGTSIEFEKKISDAILVKIHLITTTKRGVAWKPGYYDKISIGDYDYSLKEVFNYLDEKEKSDFIRLVNNDIIGDGDEGPGGNPYSYYGVSRKDFMENKNTNMSIRNMIREILENRFNVNESYDHWKATNPNDNHVDLPNDYYDILELDVYKHKDGVTYVKYRTHYGSGNPSLENLYKHFGNGYDFDINDIFEKDGKTLKLDAKEFIEQMVGDSIQDGSWYSDNLDEGV
jgi:hypothetical protein